MSDAAILAERIRGITTINEPWPHSFLDDFLPANVLAELIDGIPGYVWDHPQNRVKKTRKLPDSTLQLLSDETVLAALRDRFGFD